MTNIGIKSTQLSNIRAALLENAQNSKLEQKQTENFGNQIKDALDNVANAQNTSKTLAQNYELGKEHDLTKVMVSQNISSLAFQMTLNVRNKMLNAYKDIMNMPV
jgi:flagellar hook-basal body complex protein FliE|tara:strand:- start:186 stop:500 length:315 start_codon:yes stop_codon:yes gene_type:complete